MTFIAGYNQIGSPVEGIRASVLRVVKRDFHTGGIVDTGFMLRKPFRTSEVKVGVSNLMYGASQGGDEVLPGATGFDVTSVDA